MTYAVFADRIPEFHTPPAKTQLYPIFSMSSNRHRVGEASDGGGAVVVRWLEEEAQSGQLKKK